METTNNTVINKIIDKIKKHPNFPDSLKSWLGLQVELLEELIPNIEKEKSISKNGIIDFIEKCNKNKNQKLPDDISINNVYDLMRRVLTDFKLADGKIIKATRGRVGGLYIYAKEETISPADISELLKREEEQEQAIEESDKKERDIEKNYYPLVREWARGNGYPNCEITGGKLPRYKWENPDLIEIQYTVGEFTKALDFGIISFEVKLRVEPYAIWQSAHYKKFSREVYVAFAKSEKEIREQDEGRIFALAIELGVGVLAFESTHKNFRLIQSPSQLYPDVREIDILIRGFKELFKDQLESAEEELRSKLKIPKITI